MAIVLVVVVRARSRGWRIRRQAVFAD